MSSASRKSHVCCCAWYPLAVASGLAVALLVCQTVGARAQQSPAGPAPVAQESVPAPAPPASPAPATPAPPAAATLDAPAKPPAPLLNRSYAQMTQPSADKEKEYLRMRSEIQKMLRDGTIPADKEAMFNDYYKNYALARWTFLDRPHELAKYRSELGNELTMSYKPNRGANQARDKLQALVLQYMQGFVNPDVLARPATNFSPATRYNAILMIGELNEVEPAMGVKVVKPLPQALGILRRHAADKRHIDAVRLGALIGIRRHCRLMQEAGTEIPRDVLGDLANLAKTQESERVRSDEGQAWLRAVAAMTFGDVKGAPQQDWVANMLRGIVSESDSQPFLRYEAANSLGNIDYRKAPGLDMNPFLHSLGLMAVELCDRERQSLRDELQSKEVKPPTSGYMGDYTAAGGGGDAYAGDVAPDDMGGYGYGGMSTTTTTTQSDRQLERVRRRLKEGMTAALIGMGRKTKTVRPNEATGMSMIAGADPQKTKAIESFSNPIHDFFKKTEEKGDKDKPIQAKALDEAIAKVRQELAAAVSQVGPPAPESPVFEPIREQVQPAYGGYEMGSATAP